MDKRMLLFMDKKIQSFCNERIKKDKRISTVSKFIIALLNEGNETTIETLNGLFGNDLTNYCLKELQNLCLVNNKNGKISLQGRNTSNEKQKLFKKAYRKLMTDERWKNYQKQEKCSICGSKDNLQLHHTFYIEDAFWKPWEYPQESIKTLCSKCHMKVHFDKKHPLHERVMTREEAKRTYPKEFI